MKFRNWYLQEDDIDGKINNLLDSEGFILFFKKDDNIFAATEDSRVVFAKMKNPDDDQPSGWDNEASFSAQSVSKMMKGEPAQHVFKKDDLKEIKVIDRDVAFMELRKVANKLGDEAFKDKQPGMGYKILDLTQMFHRSRDDAPNFVRADEK